MGLDLFPVIPLDLDAIVFERATRATKTLELFFEVFEISVVHRELKEHGHGFSPAAVFF